MKRLMLTIAIVASGARARANADSFEARRRVQRRAAAWGGQTAPAPRAAGCRAKALADMKDFLPYKSYRVLDNQWITAGDGSHVISRLRGVNGQELELRCSRRRARTASRSRFTWATARRRALMHRRPPNSFALATAASGCADKNFAFRRSRRRQAADFLKTQPSSARAIYDEAKRVADLPKAGLSRTPIIDTSFTMKRQRNRGRRHVARAGRQGADRPPHGRSARFAFNRLRQSRRVYTSAGSSAMRESGHSSRG